MGTELAFELTNRFINNLRKRLAKNGFLSEDFQITQSSDPVVSDDESIILSINYLYDKQYFLTANVFDQGSTFHVSFNPGSIVTVQYVNNVTVAKYLSLVDEWIEILREELRSSALGKQVYENQEKIKEIEDLIQQKFKEDEEKFFSRSEAFELKQKLDALENQLKEVTAENETIHEEVSMLKEQVDYLSKKKWSLSFATKMFNWGLRNPQTVKQIGTVAKELLPSEIKDSIPLSLESGDNPSGE